jgi:membrane-associated phospholipid phosphatase
MLLIILYNFKFVPNPIFLIVVYTAIIAVSLYLIGKQEHTRLSRIFRYFYPFIFIGFVFESLGFIVPFINPHNEDSVLINLDRVIFGGDIASILGFLNIKGVVDYLQLMYLSYYFLPLFVIYYFYSKNEIKKLNYALFALSLGYYISYIGYIILPAIGPRYSLAYLEHMPIHGGLVYNFIHPILNSLEHIKQDCFPSGHTEISMLVFLIFKDENKKIAYIILPIVLSLILSTVVLRYHYGFDVITGLIVAFATYYLSKYIYFSKI